MTESLNKAKIEEVIAKTSAEGRSAALIFDYDGTLTPIVDRPQDALLPDSTAELLRSIADTESVRAAIMTGRTLDDIGRLLGDGPGVPVIGNHGLETGELNLYESTGFSGYIRELYETLEPVVNKYDGSLIENKGGSISIHYRNVAPEEAEQMLGEVDRIWREQGDEESFRKSSGKMVVEIRPRHIDKGTALAALLEKWFGRNWAEMCAPFYFGDDTTDEDAFEFLNREAGDAAVTIKVGDGETAAKYRLESPEDVTRAVGDILDYAAGASHNSNI